MFHGLPPRPLRSISCHHALEPKRGSAAWAAALRTKMSVDTVNRAEKMAFILPSLSCIRRFRHGPWLPCSFTSPHSGLHLVHKVETVGVGKNLVADQWCPMGLGTCRRASGNHMGLSCIQCGASGALGTLRTCRSEEHTSELQSLRHLVCR